MKKIWKWLMCLFLVLMVSITGATKVQASTYARVVYRNLLPSLGGTDILYVSGKGSTWKKAWSMGILYVGGSKSGVVSNGTTSGLGSLAYCIDLHQEAMASNFDIAEFTKATAGTTGNTINLIAYLGYQCPQRSGISEYADERYYLAAQVMIWNYIESGYTDYMTEYYAWINNYNWGNYSKHYDLSAEKADIAARIADFFVEPEWHLTDYTGTEDNGVITEANPIKGSVGTTYYIKDAKGKLANRYQYYSSDGIDFYLMSDVNEDGSLKDGAAPITSATDLSGSNNQLAIRMTKVSTENTELTSIYRVSENWFRVTATPLVYRNSNNQDLVTKGHPDPWSMKLYAQAEGARIKIIKTNANGTTLADCVLQIVDADNDTVLHEWTTEEGQEYEFKDLTPNHNYYLREVSATEGYYTSPNWSFVSGEANTTTYKTIVNSDVIYYFAKLNKANSEPLAGAVLQIIDKENSEVLYTLLSDGTEQSKATVGDTYDAENVELIKLKCDHTYTLHEVSAPDGFIIADDQDFTIPKYRPNTSSVSETEEVRIDLNKDQVVTLVKMSDEAKAKLTVTKSETSDPNLKISGARYQLFTDSDCTIPAVTYDDSGAILPNGYDQITDENGELHFQLIPGDYYLKEISAPAGYYLSSEVISINVPLDIEANASLSKEISDTQVKYKFSKVSSTDSAELSGEEFQILSEDKQTVITQWISTGEQYEVDGLLQPGTTYYLHEVTAPVGYYLNTEDVMFTVGDTAPEQIPVVTMKDDPKLINLRITKVNKRDESQRLSGAFFVLLASDHTTVVASASTDSQGIVSFNNIGYGTYYLKETKAPKGYRLDTNEREIVIDDKLFDSLDGKDYEVRLLDLTMVNTGNKAMVALYVIGGIASLLILSILIIRKRQHSNKKQR